MRWRAPAKRMSKPSWTSPSRLRRDPTPAVSSMSTMPSSSTPARMRRSREYVLGRIRAGVLEEGMVDMLETAGVGSRLRREGLVHEGFDILFAGARHRIDLAGLTGGKKVVVYGQTEVTKDLMDARAAADAKSVYEADDVSLHGIDTHPRVRFHADGSDQEVECDFVAGCDGFHGVSRKSVPASAIRTY